jgi:hypothetical protein
LTKIYCKDKEGKLRCVEASTDDSISEKGQQYLRGLLKDVDIVPEEKGFVAVVVDGGTGEQKPTKLTQDERIQILQNAVIYSGKLLDFLGTRVDNLEELIEEFNNKLQEELK